MTVPVVLSLAGSDCSAGAGLQADLKTGFALGCYPLTVVTCVVSEVPGHVAGIVPLDPDFVASQLRECLRCFPVVAIKTGMLYSPQILQAIVPLLPTDVPLVVDPVMVATAGDSLMLEETLQTYEQLLFPRASLITPNVDELVRLASLPSPPDSPQQLSDAASALARRLRCPILAKGGHLPGSVCTDILAFPDSSCSAFSHPRTPGIPTHGTGCTLSSAVASFLALGFPLPDAVSRALDFTASAIARSFSWPDHHSFALNHSLQSR